MNNIINCLLCNHKLCTVISFGQTCLANELNYFGKYEKFPLNLMQCEKCQHLQIDCIIDRDRLYKNYVYISDTGESNRKYWREQANKFRNEKVLDIGSNDGLFLSYCLENGCTVLGIDPAKNLQQLAKEKGVTQICGYFNLEMADEIELLYDKFDKITCFNCFAHNADLTPILRGVNQLLKENGQFIIEVTYGLSMLQMGTFDLVYHEHIHHWTLTSLIPYLQKFNLYIQDAEIINTHGGSLRVVIGKNNIISLSAQKILNTEKLQLTSAVTNFPKIINKLKRQLLQEIKKCQGKISIAGYPAKASTLCAFFGLNNKLIRNVYDDNVNKIGKISHLELEIKPFHNKIDNNLLILSWNYAEQIKERYKDKRCIVPFPKVRVL